MRKKKIPKTNAMRKLDQLHIAYKVHEYTWSEDHLDAEHVLKQMEKSGGAVYKTIVTVGDKTDVTVAVIPANEKISLKEFARTSGNKSVHLLPLEELEDVTGYIRGGCSPIGMKKEYPTYFSNHIKEKQSIIVSAGKRGVQIQLEPQKLVEITNAGLGDFTVPNKKS